MSGAKDMGIGLKAVQAPCIEWDVRSGIQQILGRGLFHSPPTDPTGYRDGQTGDTWHWPGKMNSSCMSCILTAWEEDPECHMKS